MAHPRTVIGTALLLTQLMLPFGPASNRFPLSSPMAQLIMNAKATVGVVTPPAAQTATVTGGGAQVGSVASSVGGPAVVGSAVSGPTVAGSAIVDPAATGLAVLHPAAAGLAVVGTAVPGLAIADKVNTGDQSETGSGVEATSPSGKLTQSNGVIHIDSIVHADSVGHAESHAHQATAQSSANSVAQAPPLPVTAAGVPAAPPPSEEVPDPLWSLSIEEKVVSLTFDDGPSSYTAEFLNILAAEQVKATFFWLTNNADLSLAPEVIKGGHQLGTHTVSHASLPGLKPDAHRAEIADSQRALDAAAGTPIYLFRPPFGAYNEATLQTANELGLQTVLWNVDPRDWDLAGNPAQIVANVMQQAKPGAIILLHERKQTLQILPQLIQGLKQAGYTFRLLPRGHSESRGGRAANIR